MRNTIPMKRAESITRRQFVMISTAAVTAVSVLSPATALLRKGSIKGSNYNNDLTA